MRFPDTAIISYGDAVLINGEMQSSTPTTIEFACNIQPFGGKARYIIGSDGNVIQRNYKIFASLFSGYLNVPEIATITLPDNKDYPIISFNVYRHHIEIEV